MSRNTMLSPNRISGVALAALALAFSALAAGARGQEAETRAIAIVPLAESQPEQYGEQTKESYGVFVGVDQFPEDDQITPLKYASKDARAMYECFVNELKYMPPENARLLVTGAEGKDRPTRDNILEAITIASQKAGPQGCIVVHLSTHGYKGYVLAETSRRAILDFSAVPLQAIESILAQSRSPRRLLIFDACREVLAQGERSLGGAAMSKDFAQAFQDAEGFAVLMSCDEGQYSYEMPEAEQGAFTHFLIKGLRGEAPPNEDGLVTVTGLSRWTQKQVEDWSRGKPAGVQSPRFDLRQATGDLPLAVSKAHIAALAEKNKQLVEAAEKLTQMFKDGHLTAVQNAQVQSALASQDPARQSVALDVAFGRVPAKYIDRLLAEAAAAPPAPVAAPTPLPTPTPAPTPAPTAAPTPAPTPFMTPQRTPEPTPEERFAGRWTLDWAKSQASLQQGCRRFIEKFYEENPMAYYTADREMAVQTLSSTVTAIEMGGQIVITTTDGRNYVFQYSNPGTMSMFTAYGTASPDGKTVNVTLPTGAQVALEYQSRNVIKSTSRMNAMQAMATFGYSPMEGISLVEYWNRAQ